MDINTALVDTDTVLVDIVHIVLVDTNTLLVTPPPPSQKRTVTFNSFLWLLPMAPIDCG